MTGGVATVGTDGAVHSAARVGVASGAPGGAVSSVTLHCVDVAPVVASDVATGPGGAGEGWAVLTSLNAAPSPPIAMRAPTPIPADSNLICFKLLTAPFRSLVRHLQPAGRTLEQLIVLGLRPCIGRIAEAARCQTLTRRTCSCDCGPAHAIAVVAQPPLQALWIHACAHRPPGRSVAPPMSKAVPTRNPACSLNPGEAGFLCSCGWGVKSPADPLRTGRP